LDCPFFYNLLYKYNYHFYVVKSTDKNIIIDIVTFLQHLTYEFVSVSAML